MGFGPHLPAVFRIVEDPHFPTAPGVLLWTLENHRSHETIRRNVPHRCLDYCFPRTLNGEGGASYAVVKALRRDGGNRAETTAGRHCQAWLAED